MPCENSLVKSIVENRGKKILLVGPPGIGKTRVAHEIAEKGLDRHNDFPPTKKPTSVP